MASRYRQDMQRAWSRIAAIPTRKLETRLGTVQYAEQGAGLPVLVCHGVFGCHADAVDGWWTRMLGNGFQVVAPSRFGYFGSTLPPKATPAEQAEVYAPLFPEDVKVIRAVSALQFPLKPRKYGSHDAQVRTAIGQFIEWVAQPERRTT